MNRVHGKYKLNDDLVIFWNYLDSTNKESLNSHHYTCLNASGEYENINYVHYLNSNSNSLYYVTLSHGKGIEDAINEMLYADDINKNDSTIKKAIDIWYEKYMINYTSYLEDTIYCNHRNIDSYGGWNSTISDKLTFKTNSKTTNIYCLNKTDSFSTINEKAMLKYPVGMFTSPEMYLLGNSTIIKNNNWSWLLSAASFPDASWSRSILTSGAVYWMPVSTDLGVRPAISLKPGTEYISGDGSMTNPYIVDTSSN